MKSTIKSQETMQCWTSALHWNIENSALFIHHWFIIDSCMRMCHFWIRYNPYPEREPRHRSWITNLAGIYNGRLANLQAGQSGRHLFTLEVCPSVCLCVCVSVCVGYPERQPPWPFAAFLRQPHGSFRKPNRVPKIHTHGSLTTCQYSLTAFYRAKPLWKSR